MSGWTAADMPDLGRTRAIVTGASSGLGVATARELARHGARVVLAVRNVAKGQGVAEEIRRQVPDAEVEVGQVDLASLASVRAFAAGVSDPIDLLVNNAGVMAPPRSMTRDGFESQIGTNHLGHFALTGLLLPRLLATPDPRVVTLASAAHRLGQIHFDNLHGERRYNNWLWYGQSKLANLMFCFELGRRAQLAGTELRSLAAHPGYAATNLQFAGPSRWYEKAVMAVANHVVAQSAEMGALPTLYASVSDLPSGTFVGPDGFQESRGHPRVVGAAGKAYDEEAWKRLWEVSEDLTGVSYDFAAALATVSGPAEP